MLALPYFNHVIPAALPGLYAETLRGRPRILIFRSSGKHLRPILSLMAFNLSQSETVTRRRVDPRVRVTPRAAARAPAPRAP